MSELHTRVNDLYYDWAAVRPRAFLRDFGIEVFREGKGGYSLLFFFNEPGPIRVLLRDAVGPTRDLAALTREVAAANADGGSPPFELNDPFVLLHDAVPRDEAGVSVEALDACRLRLAARMDAWHDAFAAVGRRPFGVHVDDDGVGHLVEPPKG